MLLMLVCSLAPQMAFNESLLLSLLVLLPLNLLFFCHVIPKSIHLPLLVVIKDVIGSLFCGYSWLYMLPFLWRYGFKQTVSKQGHRPGRIWMTTVDNFTLQNFTTHLEFGYSVIWLNIERNTRKMENHSNHCWRIKYSFRNHAWIPTIHLRQRYMADNIKGEEKLQVKGKMLFLTYKKSSATQNLPLTHKQTNTSP